MEILVRKMDDAVIFDLCGRFVFSEAAKFKQAVEDLEDSGCSHLIFNLADITFLDSTALAMLHYAHKKLVSISGKVSIVNPQPHSQKMLNLANIPSIISIHSLEEEALLVG